MSNIPKDDLDSIVEINQQRVTNSPPLPAQAGKKKKQWDDADAFPAESRVFDIIVATVVASKPAQISQKLNAVATVANKPISEPVVAFPLVFDDISSTAVRVSSVVRSSTADIMHLDSMDPPPFQRMTNSPPLPAMRGGNKKQQWDDANAFPTDSLVQDSAPSKLAVKPALRSQRPVSKSSSGLDSTPDTSLSTTNESIAVTLKSKAVPSVASAVADSTASDPVEPAPPQRMTNSPPLPAMRTGNKKQSWDDADAFPADSLNIDTGLESTKVAPKPALRSQRANLSAKVIKPVTDIDSSDSVPLNITNSETIVPLKSKAAGMASLELSAVANTTADTASSDPVEPPPPQRMTNSPPLPAMRAGNKKQSWDDAGAFPADTLNGDVVLSAPKAAVKPPLRSQRANFAAKISKPALETDSANLVVALPLQSKSMPSDQVSSDVCVSVPFSATEADSANLPPQRMTNSPLLPAQGNKKKQQWDDADAFPAESLNGAGAPKPVSKPPPLRSMRPAAITKTVKSVTEPPPDIIDVAASSDLLSSQISSAPISTVSRSQSPPISVSKSGSSFTADDEHIGDVSAGASMSCAASSSAEDLSGGKSGVGSYAEADDGLNAADEAARSAELQDRFKSMPLELALADKNFQLRVLAFAGLRQKLLDASGKPTDSVFATYAHALKLSMSEIQPKVQDVALDAIAAYVVSAAAGSALDEQLLDWAKDLVPNCILKKPAKVQDIMYAIYETLENPSEFTSQLIPHFRKVLKAPKAVSGGYAVLVACLTAFGPAICSPVALYDLHDKAMPPPHKKGFMDVFREVYKFIGEPFCSAVAETNKLPLDFREEMKKELTKIPVLELLQPTRFTRAARMNPNVKKGGAAGSAFSLVVEFSKMEAVDVFAKLREAERKLNSSLADKAEHHNFTKDFAGDSEESEALKWNHKFKRLTVLHDILKSTERHLMNANYCDMLRLLRKQLAETNVQVEGVTIACLMYMARGTRREFNREARITFPLLLPMLKEAKPQVSRKLPDTLDMLAKYCLDIDQVMPDIQASLTSVVARVRDETLQFLMRWLAIPEAQVTFLRSLPAVVDMVLSRILEERETEVRNTATTCLGHLMRAGGGVQAFATAFKKVEDLDKKRAQKLRDIAESSAIEPEEEKAQSSSTTTSSTARPPSAASSSSALVRKGSLVAATAASATGLKKQASIAAVSMSPLDVLDMPPLPLLSPEEASEQLMKAGFFTPERLAVLIAGKFTECQIMFVALASEMDQRGPAEWEPLTEALLVQVLVGGAKKPLAKTFSVILQYLLKVVVSSQLSKSQALLVLNQITDKLADNKVVGRELLFVLASQFGPKWVLWVLQSSWKSSAYKIPAAKHMTEVYSWLCQAIPEYSVSAFGPKWLLDFIKVELMLDKTFDVKDPALRTQLNAVLLSSSFMVLHRCSGESMRGVIVEGFADKASAIEKLLAAVQNIHPVSATRSIRGVAMLVPPSLEDLVPRLDVSAEMGPCVLKLANENWRIQKEGVTEVSALLQRANQRITAAAAGDFFNSLQSVLTGNQKAITLAALSMCLEMARALPSGSMKSQVRHFGEYLVAFLGNIDKVTKQKALELLQFLIKELGLQPFVHWFVKMIVTPNSREPTLDLILSCIAPPIASVTVEESKDASSSSSDSFVQHIVPLAPPVPRYDLSELLKPLVLALTDKSSDIRGKAEQVLDYLCLITPLAMSPLRDELQQLSKAQQLSMSALMDKYNGVKAASGAGKAIVVERHKTAVPLTKSGVPSVKVTNPIGASAAGNTGAPQSSKQKAQQGLEEDYLMKPSNDRAARVSKNRRYNSLSAYEDVCRIEELDVFRNYLATHILAPRLTEKLFSPEHADQTAAFEFLRVNLPLQSPQLLMSGIDQLMKLFSCRLAQPKIPTVVFLKILDTLIVLLQILRTTDEKLVDFELDLIVPCLIEKTFLAWTNPITQKALECVRLFALFSMPHKIAGYLCDALKPKNKSLTLAALTELHLMLGPVVNAHTRGEPIGPVGGCELVWGQNLKNLRRLLPYLNESTFAPATFLVIGTTYTVIGDALWRYLGPLEEKTRLLIEERMRKSYAVIKRPAAIEPSRAASPSSLASVALPVMPIVGSETQIVLPSLQTSSSHSSVLASSSSTLLLSNSVSSLLPVPHLGSSSSSQPLPCLLGISPSVSELTFEPVVTTPSIVSIKVDSSVVSPVGIAAFVNMLQSMMQPLNSLTVTMDTMLEATSSINSCVSELGKIVLVMAPNSTGMEDHSLLETLEKLMWCAFGGGGLPNPYLLGPVGALIPHLASNTMRLMRSFFEKNNDYAHSLPYTQLESLLVCLVTQVEMARSNTPLQKELTELVKFVLKYVDIEIAVVALLVMASRSVGPEGFQLGTNSWKYHEFVGRCLLRLTKQLSSCDLHNTHEMLRECGFYMNAHPLVMFSDYGLVGAKNPLFIVLTLVQVLCQNFAPDVNDYIVAYPNDIDVRSCAEREWAKLTREGKPVVTERSVHSINLKLAEEEVSQEEKADRLLRILSQCTSNQINDSAMESLMSLVPNKEIGDYIKNQLVLSGSWMSVEIRDIISIAIRVRESAIKIATVAYLTIQRKGPLEDMTKTPFDRNITIEKTALKLDELQQKMASLEAGLASIRMPLNATANSAGTASLSDSTQNVARSVFTAGQLHRVSALKASVVKASALKAPLATSGMVTTADQNSNSTYKSQMIAAGLENQSPPLVRDSNASSTVALSRSSQVAAVESMIASSNALLASVQSSRPTSTISSVVPGPAAGISRLEALRLRLAASRAANA